ncbi:MAG: DUF2911 domain-containing protein [Flavobacteriaceae bacterium]|nr:DUF2911 domain-containing protein [Flavobacteriaceae bacterium]
MKILKYSLFGVLIIAILSLIYFLNTPPKSPFEKVVFKNDSLELEVEYSRPYKKNRLIFGNEKDKALVPYEKYWRLGANNATIFKNNKDILFNNEKLLKGKYRMYAIPNELDWVIVLNSEAGKFGYFEPDYDKDILRVTIPSQPLLGSIEQFTIHIEENENGISLVFKWDKTAITIPINSV